MNRPILSHRRNIGIISHIDAGKTTTTERMLYCSGAVHRIGKVDEGTATTDWMIQEKERGISITSAAISCLWTGYEINIIDTPGHVDFTVEVERSLRVLDGAIAIFSCVEGVEAQSETVWSQADKFKVPRIVYINKIDRIGANFLRTLEMIKQKFSKNFVLMQFPNGEADEFEGQIDILNNQIVSWEKNDIQQIKFEPINEKFKEKVFELRNEITEVASDYNEIILENFLEGKDVENHLIEEAIKKGVVANEVVPVFVGSSLKSLGIQPLLDGIIKFLPSPEETPPVVGIVPEESELSEAVRLSSIEEPFSALVFKVALHENRRLSFIRVYSGQAKVGDLVWNPTRRKKERFSRIFRMYSDKRERVEKIGPGDIIAVLGLKETLTGDTLCDLNSPISFESISPPEPVISIAVEPKETIDLEKLQESLKKLMLEDPTFIVELENESGQIVMSGMGELHLDVLTRRLIDEFDLEIRVGEPRVVFRETLCSIADDKYLFDKIIGGKTQYAKLHMRVSPTPGKGIQINFENDVYLIPESIINVTEEAIRSSCSGGILAGYPLIDIKVDILDMEYIPEKSSEFAFSAAASVCFNNVCNNASGQLLEPIMQVEVSTLEEHLGGVISELNTRNGNVSDIKDGPGEDNFKIIEVTVPLRQMFGFTTVLRSLTQGRGTFVMTFFNFSPCDVSL
ncbi:MAG: elongation factor G [Nitrospinae bacterium]|nr:elongation factor G [Nitrospinota bacterium]